MMKPINDPALFWYLLLISLILFIWSGISGAALIQHSKEAATETNTALSAWLFSVELEESIADLLALLTDHVEAVSAIHRRIEHHLDECEKETQRFPQERTLLGELRRDYLRYRTIWDRADISAEPERAKLRQQAIRSLKDQTLPISRRLEQQLRAHVDRSNSRQKDLWQGWGVRLAIVGLAGGLGGLLLGFGAAYATRRSIINLQVQLQDSAGKLTQSLPALVWPPGSSIDELGSQLAKLDEHLSEVVSKLQQREREVLRSDQLAKLGRVAAGMAHEIRNPLTAIKLLVQAAIESKQPPRSDDLRIIEGEIRRMETTVSTLLSYAKSREPTRSKVKLNSLIGDVAELIKPAAARQQVQLELQVPTEPIAVHADPAQLQQVFLNLAFNALDAMPTGGQLLFQLTSMGDQVEVAMCDTGTGILPEIAVNLFEPFASTKETGVGLGLAVCKRIVDDHSGTLIAENRSPKGACFRVILPNHV